MRVETGRNNKCPHGETASPAIAFIGTPETHFCCERGGNQN